MLLSPGAYGVARKLDEKKGSTGPAKNHRQGREISLIKLKKRGGAPPTPGKKMSFGRLREGREVGGWRIKSGVNCASGRRSLFKPSGQKARQGSGKGSSKILCAKDVLLNYLNHFPEKRGNTPLELPQALKRGNANEKKRNLGPKV